MKSSRPFKQSPAVLFLGLLVAIFIQLGLTEASVETLAAGEAGRIPGHLLGPRTYCNPLPLPDYPRGMFAFEPERSKGSWWIDRSQDYREAGDPTVIRFESAWYLFSSCGMAWQSCRWQ